MFYIAKVAQLAGLIIIGFGFLKNFPELMNYRILGAGLLLFTFGWIVQRFMLTR